jgi:DNA-damage-inducible protein J
VAADSIVKARIDSGTKERASAALAVMGLSISDAIRLLMFRVAEEQRLPFDVKIPNAASREAMKELNEGRGHSSASAEDLFKDLGIWVLTPVWSRRFKRDVRRAEKRGKNMDKLKAILILLIEEKPLPSEGGDHLLKGQ